ncbi:hypothetical protein MKS88_004443 [Plasmodium brasilianum]|uniref:Uncharacterized protein n=2 Tax=Plasmodium (Plasmodium) TaxID=418103 RepID=A0ACB9Y4S8_PLABR|nr:hypothetical protein MKS88_004443 [Plasmodium brasilianum]
MSEDLEYIRGKKIIEILEGLLGYVYYRKPKNIVESIIEELKKLEKEKEIKRVFDEEDIIAMYNFLNLENNKYITKDKCILGLNQFVLNNKQREYMENIKIANDRKNYEYIKSESFKEIINFMKEQNEYLVHSESNSLTIFKKRPQLFGLLLNSNTQTIK